MSTDQFINSTQRKIREIAEIAREDIARLQQNDRVEHDAENVIRTKNDIEILFSNKDDA